MRTDNRQANELRPMTLETGVNKYAEGSCMVRCGNTHVICTATIEERVPMWLKGQGTGWITSEYGMLPRSTGTRMDREAIKGQSGRTHEIQRLVGRALRGVVDMKALGEMTVKVDCDVIQADGGTRTASITGGYVALYLAIKKRGEIKKFSKFPITGSVCAISCGIVDGEARLDLDYEEDSNAGTDANFVMTGDGKLVEVQGTAEGEPFSKQELMALLDLAEKGCVELTELQKKALDI